MKKRYDFETVDFLLVFGFIGMFIVIFIIGVF